MYLYRGALSMPSYLNVNSSVLSLILTATDRANVKENNERFANEHFWQNLFEA